MELKTWRRSPEDVRMVAQVRQALPDMPIYVDGNVTPGDAPGFGAALDRRKLERYAF